MDVEELRRKITALSLADRQELLDELARDHPGPVLRALHKQMATAESEDMRLLALEAADVLRRYAGDIVLGD